MANEITKNLNYLTKGITNVEGLLIQLIEKEIFSFDEQEKIMCKETNQSRNFELLKIIQAKDWDRVRNSFLDILRNTNNGHCADKIENLQTEEISSKKRKICVLEKKWWPNQKFLVRSFYERKESGKLLIEDLVRKLEDSESGITVINQKVTVSGLGGVGKTTTAKWFANVFSKKYEHIIWIDCGEGSLLSSFKKLARDLKLEGRSELDLVDLSRASFEKLKDFKCLWIFDNAECYVGKQGIRHVLPENKCFHSIITSRNREWGNENGDGKIYEFQLGVFKTEESVAFLKNNITNLPDEFDIDQQLQKFSELVGNLPLALQIAVATINGKKIDISEYMQRIRKTDDILHIEFDDYEKTINKTMKISLDIINHQEGDSGNLAYQILSLFGYITADAVEIDFFAKVLGQTEIEIKAAADLLEKYSLITKHRGLGGLSIHRLLQQVIRHNGKNSQRETLRKILNVNGHLDYKLLPYTFADEELQSEFIEVKTKLIDQLKLEEITIERRFQEAVDLSLIITNTLQTSSSLYNYAVCLENNGQRIEALAIFEKMYWRPHELKLRTADSGDDMYWNLFVTNSGEFLDFQSKPTKANLAGKLFINYRRKKKTDKAREILSNENVLTFRKSPDVLNEIIQSISYESDSNNRYNENGFFVQESSITKIQTFYGMQLQLEHCSIFTSIAFPRIFHCIQLKNVTVFNEKNEELEKFDARNYQFPAHLKVLELSFSKSTAVNLSVDQFNNIEYIQFGQGVQLAIATAKLCPKSLILGKCTFVRDNQILNQVNLEEFTDFRQTKYLELLGEDTEYILPMLEPISIDQIVLEGKVTIPDLLKVQWSIEKLTLTNFSFVDENKLKVKELEIKKSNLNLGVLPKNLNMLCFEHMKNVSSNGNICHPQLQYLKFSIERSSNLVSKFDGCVQLRYLCLIFLRAKVFRLETEVIPTSVKVLKLSKFPQRSEMTIIGNKIIFLDILILFGFPFLQLENQLIDITKILQPTKLVINCNIDEKLELRIKPLVQSLLETNIHRSYAIRTIVIGEFTWKTAFQSSTLSKYVDQKAKFYIFDEQCEGFACEDQEFWKLIDLPYCTTVKELKISSREERLRTFQNWSNKYLSSEYCAKQGFFYCHRWDKIQCVFCDKATYDTRRIFALNVGSHNDHCRILCKS